MYLLSTMKKKQKQKNIYEKGEKEEKWTKRRIWSKKN